MVPFRRESAPGGMKMELEGRAAIVTGGGTGVVRYCASKAAVNILTVTLARVMAPNISGSDLVTGQTLICDGGMSLG